MKVKIHEEVLGGYIVKVKKNIISPWLSVSGIVSLQRAREIASKY
ncbi:MAG: hypothetical protein ACRCVU_11310 [Flavobacterium sp.]